MTQRSFDDAFWNDPFVQTLEKDAKFLFLYLWTNKHCNPAGLYEITQKTISFETDLDTQKLPSLFQMIKPKVEWYPDQNIVWVKNFVKRQSKSPKWMIAVANCLQAFSNNGLVKAFLDYNSKVGVSIPYQYPIDTIPIPSYTVPVSYTNTNTDNIGGIVKGGKELKKYPPEFITLARQVFVGLKERRGYTSRSPAAEASHIYKMLKEKFSPDEILKAHDLIKQQPFYSDKPVTMMVVFKNIYEVLKNGANKQRPGKLPEKYPDPDDLRG